MISFELNELNKLPTIAKQLLDHLNNNKVLAFFGELGAGKTTIIKEICNELEVKETVTSPSFSLVNEYSTKKGNIVYHFDFYRIVNIEEVYDFGYEEYFYSNNYCFIEWPEKIETILPENTKKLYINVEDSNKRLLYLY